MNVTQEQLKQILHYCPDTGIFTWKTSKSRVVKVGDVAGCIDSLGYRIIRINGRNQKAHRLAWLYVTGKWPERFIDHKNQIRSDNSFENLREATDVENMQNIKLSVKNTSGFKGVSFHKKHGKWIAHAKHNNKTIHIGYYETAEQASEAYKEFTKKIHGEFYREAA